MDRCLFGKGGGLWGDTSIVYWGGEEEEEGVAHRGCGDSPLNWDNSLCSWWYLVSLRCIRLAVEGL
jgi:hypothetical protein